MKTILLNGSPRKNRNTAQMLKSAEEGAKAAGAQTEYVELYDLHFTGCRSCLACKRKGAQRCRCFWKDDLSPLLDRIFQADAQKRLDGADTGRPRAGANREGM